MDSEIVDVLNAILDQITEEPFITPFIAHEAVRRTLQKAYIQVPTLPGDIDPEEGGTVYELGDIDGDNDDDVFLYFEYVKNDEGTYNIFCELVSLDDLDELVQAKSDEDEDNDLSEAVYKNPRRENKFKYSIPRAQRKGEEKKNSHGGRGICPTCGGSGKIGHKTQCPDCSGSGKISENKYYPDNGGLDDQGNYNDPDDLGNDEIVDDNKQIKTYESVDWVGTKGWVDRDSVVLKIRIKPHRGIEKTRNSLNKLGRKYTAISDHEASVPENGDEAHYIRFMHGGDAFRAKNDILKMKNRHVEAHILANLNYTPNRVKDLVSFIKKGGIKEAKFAPDFRATDDLEEWSPTDPDPTTPETMENDDDQDDNMDDDRAFMNGFYYDEDKNEIGYDDEFQNEPNQEDATAHVSPREVPNVPSPALGAQYHDGDDKDGDEGRMPMEQRMNETSSAKLIRYIRKSVDFAQKLDAADEKGLGHLQYYDNLKEPARNAMLDKIIRGHEKRKELATRREKGITLASKRFQRMAANEEVVNEISDDALYRYMGANMERRIRHIKLYDKAKSSPNVVGSPVKAKFHMDKIAKLGHYFDLAQSKIKGTDETLPNIPSEFRRKKFDEETLVESFKKHEWEKMLRTEIENHGCKVVEFGRKKDHPVVYFNIPGVGKRFFVFGGRGGHGDSDTRAHLNARSTLRKFIATEKQKASNRKP